MTPDQTVAPINWDPTLALLREEARAANREAKNCIPVSLVALMALFDRSDRLAAAEARALPAPRLMRTVEEVRDLPNGHLRALRARGEWEVAEKRGDRILTKHGWAADGARHLVGAHVQPLPDIAIPSEEG